MTIEEKYITIGLGVLNFFLMYKTFTLNKSLAEKEEKKEQREKEIRLETLRMNVIQAMEYNAQVIKENAGKEIKKEDLIILNKFEEKLYELMKAYSLEEKTNIFYSYFLKISKDKIDENDFFDKKYYKFLNLIPKEESYYFMKEDYSQVLMMLKRETNKYITKTNEKINIKIEKIGNRKVNINTEINCEGIENGKTVFYDEKNNICFLGEVKSNKKLEGKIKTNDYEYEGEFKNDEPYNGYIKCEKDYVIYSYTTKTKIYDFEGELKEGKAWKGTGIAQEISMGKVEDLERLNHQKYSYFEEEQTEREDIPEEVRKEFFQCEEEEDLKKRADFILKNYKVTLKQGMEEFGELKSQEGMSEINKFRYE